MTFMALSIREDLKAEDFEAWKNWGQELSYSAGVGDLSILDLAERCGVDFREEQYQPLLHKTLYGARYNPEGDQYTYAIRLLDLGVDPTYTYARAPEDMQKALDILLGEHGLKLQPAEKDAFSAEQREALIKKMIEKTRMGDESELASSATLNTILRYGRAESVPYLEMLGIKVEDDDFVHATSPIARRSTVIDMMKALKPLVSSVNVSDEHSRTAAKKVLSVGNLKAFQWLEDNGLETEGRNFMFAASTIRDEEKAKACIRYLKTKGFDPNQMRFAMAKPEDPIAFHDSPLTSALEEGLFSNALHLIDAGANLRRGHIAYLMHKALNPAFQSDKENLSDENVDAFLDALEERGLLTPEYLAAEISLLQDYDVQPYAPDPKYAQAAYRLNHRCQNMTDNIFVNRPEASF